MKWMRRTYDWVLSLADRPHGGIALFCLAFAEASFFPIPPDPLLIALIIPKRKLGFLFAFVCTLGSVLGGIAGYSIGWQLWHMVADFFFQYVPGVTPEGFENVKNIYHAHSFWAVFISGFTPIPYKLFTIAAGVVGIPLFGFIVASICGRGLRFFILSLLIQRYGESIRNFIDKYFNLLTIVFMILLLGGFMVIKLFFH